MPLSMVPSLFLDIGALLALDNHCAAAYRVRRICPWDAETYWLCMDMDEDASSLAGTILLT